MSKIMVPCERFCRKEYTCERPITSGLKVMAKVKVLVHTADANTDLTLKVGL